MLIQLLQLLVLKNNAAGVKRSAGTFVCQHKLLSLII